jgi:hypothetical protein
LDTILDIQDALLEGQRQAHAASDRSRGHPPLLGRRQRPDGTKGVVIGDDLTSRATVEFTLRDFWREKKRVVVVDGDQIEPVQRLRDLLCPVAHSV